MGKWRRWRWPDGHAEGCYLGNSEYGGWHCCWLVWFTGIGCQSVSSPKLEQQQQGQGFVFVSSRPDKRPCSEGPQQLHVRQYHHTQQPFPTEVCPCVSGCAVRGVAAYRTTPSDVYWRLQAVPNWIEQNDSQRLLQGLYCLFRCERKHWC